MSVSMVFVSQEDAAIAEFVRTYVVKRRRIAANAKAKGYSYKDWPGANATPFIHNLARLVDVEPVKEEDNG